MISLRSIALAGIVALAALSHAQVAAPGAELWGDVTLYRDEWGVPHVYAGSVRGMGFGFGYAQAEDHLEAMLFAYRVANGRAAEIMGEPYAESDMFSLRMGHARLAARAWEGADPVTRDLCEGFALGVNAWLTEHPSAAPAWADGVQPQDILALWHAFLMSFAPLDLPGVWSRPPAFETGNAWALAPDRSADGKTMLVINPHQYHDGVFRWCEAHLAVEDYDVYGATLFGLPAILMGHNATLGWALTPNRADFADVYEERIATAGGGENLSDLEAALADELPALMYYSQAQPFRVRTASGMEERVVPSYILDRGPILEAEGKLFSWRIGGYRDFGGLLQLLEMGRAPNAVAFARALSAGQIPCFQILSADQEGTLFYLYNAHAGTRALPELYYTNGEIKNEIQTTFKIPVPAHWDAALWGTTLSFENLPHVENPKSGYLQACGNPPQGATDEAQVLGIGWPGWFVGDPDTYRARRVRQLLRTGTRDLRDMQSLLYDSVAPAAQDMAGRLLAIAKAQPEKIDHAHPDLAEAIKLFEKWNFTAETSSEAMTFYQVWWATLRARHVIQFGDDRALYETILSDNPAAQAIAIETAGDAARLMRNDLHGINVPWGEAHVIRRGARTEPIFGSGTGEPLFIASDYAYDKGKWEATYGYGFAMAVEFGAPARAVSIVPFGASENPQSPHYDDQLTLMLQRRFKVTRYTRDDVLRYAATGHGTLVALSPQGAIGEVIFSAPAPIDASLKTLADAPAPLPDKTERIGVCIQASRTPEAVPVAIALSLVIPEAELAKHGIETLSIHAFAPGLGWQALATTRDAVKRLLSAEYGGPAIFAVIRTPQVSAPAN